MAGLVRYRWLYLLLLPGLVYFLVFKYRPMYGLTIAFKDYVPFLGYSGSAWVGLKHFQELFTGPDFGRLLGNTMLLALLTIVFVFPAPIVVALLLNELRISVVKRSVQSLIYIPHFLSWTIVASLTYLLFSVDFGVIAHWIHGLVGGRKVDYVAQEDWFRPIIVLQLLWKQTGWGTIIYLAALAGVDTQLYEAARVDGAGRWRQFWHITLPAIRPADRGHGDPHLRSPAGFRLRADLADDHVAEPRGRRCLRHLRLLHRHHPGRVQLRDRGRPVQGRGRCAC